MENFGCDLRAAVHTVAKKPGFTIVVALMLAASIATNTAIFSVVYGVLLRPLPYGLAEIDNIGPGKERSS